MLHKNGLGRSLSFKMLAFSPGLLFWETQVEVLVRRSGQSVSRRGVSCEISIVGRGVHQLYQMGLNLLRGRLALVTQVGGQLVRLRHGV